MTTRRPHLNILLTALTAVVGMLSFGGVASACSVKPAEAPRACCAGRPSAECGCCGETREPRSSPEAVGAIAIVSSATEAHPVASSPSCECRSNEPVAPSDRPAQRVSAGHTDEVVGESSTAFFVVVKPCLALNRIQLPNESPPKSPLYLRTSRLLI